MNEMIAPANATITSETCQVSVRGKWIEAPSVLINGQRIVISSGRIRIASLQDEDWAESELENPEICIDAWKSMRDLPGADILRFSQKVPSIDPRHQYPMELRSIAVARIGKDSGWWESLPQETRKNVRRAQKRGVTTKVVEFGPEVIEGIARVQNETPIRQGRAYPHYGKTLEQVKRDHGAFLDRSDFICAYFEGQIIGFLKLVYRGDVASLLQLNAMVEHYDKRTSNALLARAVELCESRGIHYMTYGLFNYGNKGWTPLREFKVRHGFEEMLVPNYFVPLTAWGRVCVQLKLYRSIMEILPESVITTALRIRSAWYDRSTKTKPV